MDNSKKTGIIALITLVAVLGLFYSLNLPQFVQGGDTGELVAAGYRLLVPHPPGYPLWVWLQHVFTHFVPIGSIFWRASLLSSLFACSALILVGLPLVRNIFDLLVCVPVLALSPVFVEAALLPDVFSFHAMFVAAIGSLYLFAKTDSKAFRLGVPFLVCLGLAHHLTTIFLFPLILGVMYESRKSKETLRDVAVGLCLGVCTVILLYGSMLMFNTKSSFSWGNLHGGASIWHHFLRSDYGTFRLAAEEKTGTLNGFIFFFKTSWLEFVGSIGLVAFALLRSGRALLTTRTWVWTISCFFSLVFFVIANVTPVGMGEEVLRRFCVMPVVQFALLAACFVFHADMSTRDRRAVGAFAAVVIVVLGSRLIDFAGLHQDSVFEDYATNLLNQTAHHKPAVILNGNDNAYFGIRYVQAVLGKNPDVAVASPSLFFHPWYLDKIRQVSPAFQLPNFQNIWNSKKLDIDKDLIEPNFQLFSVVISKGHQDGNAFHTTFLGVGRMVSKGSGVDFDDNAASHIQLRTQYQERPQGPQSFSKGLLYAEYSHFFLAKGLSDLALGRVENAVKDWRNALDRVPYAFPALTNLCQLVKEGDPHCSHENRAMVQEQAIDFF